MSRVRKLYKSGDLVAVVDTYEDNDFGFEVYRLEDEVTSADPSSKEVKAIRFDRDAEHEEQYLESDREIKVEISYILRKVMKISEGVLDVDGTERAMVVIARKLTQTLKHMASMALRSGSEEEPSEAAIEEGDLGKRKPAKYESDIALKKNKTEEMHEGPSASGSQMEIEQEGMEAHDTKKSIKPRGLKEVKPREVRQPKQPRESKPTKEKKVIEYKRGKFNIKIQEADEDRAWDGSSNILNSDCCDICSNRECIRAASTNNPTLLKNIIAQKNKITSIFQPWGTDDHTDCFKYCIKNNLQELMDIILSEIKPNKPQADTIYYKSADSFGISQIDTGSNDKYAYGVATRKVALGRGNREGVNALCTDFTATGNNCIFDILNSSIEDCGNEERAYWEFVMRHCSVDIFKKLLSVLSISYETFFAYAVRGCNRELAAYVAERLIKADGYGLNNLHLKALTLTKVEEMGTFRSASVKKKSIGATLIFPIFCAAINPHLEVFVKMYESLDDRFIRDENSSSIIFYAAMNENPEILKYMLDNGVECREANKQKMTPLMMAASHGRSESVAILIRKFDNTKKKSRDGYGAIHYAVMESHIDTVRALVENGADVNLGGKDRMTPLALASSLGLYDMVKLILEKGGKSIKKDKYKRTPLILALKNCHARVASLLLAHGCPFDEPDSSDNYPIHYACSYGCLDGLDILIRAGANPNVYNSWKLTPIAGAMMKNHFGIINKLLEYPDIDVNCKDDNGRTLLSNAIRNLTEKTVNFAELIITKHKADISIADLQGNTALHHLMLTHSSAKFIQVTCNTIGMLENVQGLKQLGESNITLYLRLCELLSGDELKMFNTLNSNSKTPLQIYFDTLHSMLSFNLESVCPSTRFYSQALSTYVQKSENYHKYLEGDKQLREIKYDFLNKVLSLMSKYYKAAKNQNKRTIQDELSEEISSDNQFVRVNESILHSYINAFRNHTVTRIARDAKKFCENESQDLSKQEIMHATNVTKRLRKEFMRGLTTIINQLDISVQGKYSKSSAKTEILYFLTSRWSGLFNIPDTGMNALKMIQQQSNIQRSGQMAQINQMGNAQGFGANQFNYGLQQHGGFGTCAQSTSGFNIGAQPTSGFIFGAQPAGDFTFGAQPSLFSSANNFGFPQPAPHQSLGYTGFGTGNGYAPVSNFGLTQANAMKVDRTKYIDLESTGVDKDIYESMKAFRKLQISEREELTLELLDVVKQSQHNTVDEAWEEQHSFCQNILQMVPSIYFINSVTTLELMGNDDAEYVLKSCNEMISSNTAICKKFISLAQLGVAELKAKHIGKKISLYESFCSMLMSIWSNLSTYIDITQKNTDHLILEKEIDSRLDLIVWVLQEFIVDENTRADVVKSMDILIKKQKETLDTEFKRLEVDKVSRIYQRSAGNAFQKICKDLFKSFSNTATSHFELKVDTATRNRILSKVFGIMNSTITQVCFNFETQGVVYQKHLLLKSTSIVCKSIFAGLKAVASEINDEQNLKKKIEAVQRQTQRLVSEIDHRIQFRDKVIELTTKLLSSCTGIRPEKSEITKDDYDFSNMLSVDKPEHTSLAKILNNLVFKCMKSDLNTIRDLFDCSVLQTEYLESEDRNHIAKHQKSIIDSALTVLQIALDTRALSDHSLDAYTVCSVLENVRHNTKYLLDQNYALDNSLKYDAEIRIIKPCRLLTQLLKQIIQRLDRDMHLIPSVDHKLFSTVFDEQKQTTVTFKQDLDSYLIQSNCHPLYNILETLTSGSLYTSTDTSQLRNAGEDLIKAIEQARCDLLLTQLQVAKEIFSQIKPAKLEAFYMPQIIRESLFGFAFNQASDTPESYLAILDKVNKCRRPFIDAVASFFIENFDLRKPNNSQVYLPEELFKVYVNKGWSPEARIILTDVLDKFFQSYGDITLDIQKVKNPLFFLASTVWFSVPSLLGKKIVDQSFYEFILQRSQNPNILFEFSSTDGKKQTLNLYEHAFENRNSNFLKVLLKKADFDDSVMFEDKEALFSILDFVYGHEDIRFVKDLSTKLSKDELISSHRVKGFTPFLKAINEYQSVCKDESSIYYQNDQFFVDVIRALVEGGLPVNELFDRADDMKDYLKSGTDFTNRHLQYANALHMALNGKINSLMLCYLAQEAKVNPNKQRNEGNTPLHDLCERKNIQMDLIEMLLKNQADPNISEDFGETCIFSAARNGDLQLVELLVKYGAKLNISNNEDMSPLVITIKEKNIPAIERLIEIGSDVSFHDRFERNSLHWAINFADHTANSSFEIEDILIKAGVEINKKDLLGRTPLHYPFVKIGNVTVSSQVDPIESVNSLLAKKNLKVDEKDVFGNTPLMYAAQRGSLVSALYLIDKQADINSINIEGNNVLSVAMIADHDHLAITMVNKDATWDTRAKIYSLDKREAVYTQAMNKIVEKTLQPGQVKQFILEKLEAYDEESEKKIKGYNSIIEMHTFRLAIRHNWQGLAYMILSRGYDIGEAVFSTIQEKKFNYTFTLLTKREENEPYLFTDSQGDNLAHLTCYAASQVNRDLLEKIFRVLVRKGIKLTSQNAKGHNALHCASVCGSTVMIQLLLEQDVHPDNRDAEGRTPMMLAAQNMNLEALKLLFVKTKVKSEQDIKGRNVLHYICMMPNVNDTELRPLLENISEYVNPNEADSHGKLPIHYLLKHSLAIESTLYLMSKVTSISAKDIKGQSILSVALKHTPTIEVITQLINRGSQVDGIDHVGRTALGNLLSLSHYSESKKLEVIKLIVEKAHFDINQPSSFKTGIEKQSKLPIYQKMSLVDYLFYKGSNSEALIDVLLKKGAHLDMPNDLNMKSLEIIISKGSGLSILNMLLNDSVTTKAVSCDFMMHSIDSCYAKEKQRVTGLCYLIEMNLSLPHFEKIIARGGNDIYKKDDNGISPFIYAISQKAFHYLKPMLMGQLTSGKNIEFDMAVPEKAYLFDSNPPMTTPLCYAIQNRRSDAINMMLENGASPNYTVIKGKPPAYYLLRESLNQDLFAQYLRQFIHPEEYNLRCASNQDLVKIDFNFKIELSHKVSYDKEDTYLVDPLYYAVANKMPIENIEEMLAHYPALDYLHPVTNQSAFSLALETYILAAKRILRSATGNSPYCMLRKLKVDLEDKRSAQARQIPINEYMKITRQRGKETYIETLLPLNKLYNSKVKDQHIERAVLHGADFNLQDGDKNQNLIMLAIYRNDLEIIKEIEKLACRGKSVRFDRSKVDNLGRTPIHMVVNSHKNGSFENVELLNLLAIYYDVNKTDNNNFPPYYYASMQDSGVMLDALTKLGAREFEMPFGVRRAPTSLISFATFPAEVPAYEEDAEAYLAEKEAEIKRQIADPPKIIVLDPRIPNNISQTSSVIVDEEQRAYDTYMTKVDIKKGQYGGSVFYRMQLLHESNRDVHILFTRYGRIGDSGQHQITSFSKKEEAVAEFMSIFKSKSGNEWKDIDNFQRVKKKYKVVKLDQTTSKEQLEDFYTGRHEKDLLPTNLTEGVRNILTEVASSKVLFARVKAVNFDISRLPLSKLNKPDLLQAFTLLKEMKKVAMELQEERNVDVIDSEPERIFELLDELSEMTSEYYELIPSTRYRTSAIPPMESLSAIDQNIMIVRELLEVEVAVKILLGARLKIKEMHPLDYCYNSLNIKLMELDDQSIERTAILDYVKQSYDYGHPDSIQTFALERQGETERFAKHLNMKNRKLLWHGTQTMNFIGVLNKGLKIAPPEAPHTGAMFGKGIYFSDTFVKSYSYCNGQIKIVLLCEVALGNSEPIFASKHMTQPSEGYQSVMGMGQNTPDPKQDVVIPNGMIIPLGPLTKRHNPDNLVRLSYNELVVYNEDQVKIRYMVVMNN